MKIDTTKLAQDIRDAREAASQALVNHSDNGTCNFDTCVLFDVPFTSKVAGAVGDAFASKWLGKKCIMLSPPPSGQAARRTIAAEKMTAVLRERGWNVSMYYQMD